MLAIVAVVVVLNLFSTGVAKAMYPDDEDKQDKMIALQYAIFIVLILVCHYITMAVIHYRN